MGGQGAACRCARVEARHCRVEPGEQRHRDQVHRRDRKRILTVHLRGHETRQNCDAAESDERLCSLHRQISQKVTTQHSGRLSLGAIH